jgi:hypothetical protein
MRRVDRTRWHPSMASSKAPPNLKKVIVMLHRRKIHTEGLMSDRVVLCDCHCAPMYHEAVSIMPNRGFVMCWVSDCGRYYSRSLGYFHLRPPMPVTFECIDKETRRMTRCLNSGCSTDSSMAIVHLEDAQSDEGKICWHCFECGRQVPHHKPRLRSRSLTSSRPSQVGPHGLPR